MPARPSSPPTAPPLSRERVLRAAYALAEEQGVAAVTMRAVAARLGVEAMSLYHHVPNKQALLDGLVDQVVQAAGFPEGPVTQEEWIRGTAAGLRRLAREHPRVVPLFRLRTIPLDDVRSALPFEAGLAAFVAGGRDVPSAYGAMQASTLALLALADLAAARTEAALAGVPEPEPSGIDHLDAAQFPLLRELLAVDPDPLDQWDSLIEALVRGFA